VRIVSLHASATEIVYFLGLSEQLVGVSADSDWPVELVRRLPVLNTVAFDASRLTSAEIDAAASGDGHRGTSLYHVDSDLLRHLRPDLILTQEMCAVCAVSRDDVERASRTLGYRPRILSLNPISLGEILDDVQHVADVAEVGDRGAALVRSLRVRLDDTRVCTARLPRLKVCCMEWLDPPYSAGHWVPEMVEYAGGVEVLGKPNGPSRRVDWQEIVDCVPEALVLIPCSFSLERTEAEFGLLQSRPDWGCLPAVRASRVFAGHTHLFSQSGPRLVDGVEALAHMLHPEAFTTELPAGQALKMRPDGQGLEPF
jgi:iron complex transport system substrate-binding protein